MDGLRQQAGKVVKADGGREPDADQAETELGDVIAGKADDEEDEHEETLEVECALEFGLGVVPLVTKYWGRVQG